MNIPYRTRQGLKRTALVLLALLVLAVTVWLCWLLWLSRYVIYTRDGAKLDFDLPAQVSSGELALPPEEAETISIYYNEGDNAVNTSTELRQIIGYYVEVSQLQDNMDTVRSQIQALPAGTAVLVDVKNMFGSAYYSSAVVGSRSSEIDTAAMDELISFLDKSGMYTIARVPALRDKNYGLNHVPDGLYHSSRGYLWMDDNGCYWLNPDSEGTISYLVQIANELKGLGFDEVVFDDFYVPEGSNIYFPNDRAKSLATAAQSLVTSCATDTFAVSFVMTTSFTAPEGRSRLFMENVEASQATVVAAGTGLADPAIRLVFLTDVHDTRFDIYSVLRPLSAAH